MNTQILVLNDKRGYVYIGNPIAIMDVKRSNRIMLHYGALTVKLHLKIDGTLEPGTVMIPRQLTDEIAIPDLPYLYYFQGNHLFVGPVIGLLVKPRSHLNRQLMRFSEYDKIKGLVFLFREHRINKKTKTILGYYYDPVLRTLIRGKFPYPSAIFNRAPMDPETYNHFKVHIGDHIFNHPFGISDKWALWEQLAIKSKLKKHLPQTALYSRKSLENMLHLYPEIYLKPTTLAKGKGVLHVKKDSDGYILTDNGGKQFQLKSLEDLFVQIQSMQLPQTYLIQQAIPFQHKGRKIDFRVYFQKDGTKTWKYSGMEAKIAHKGSIITNFKNRSNLLPGETILRRVYGLDKDRIRLLVDHILQTGANILKTLDTPAGHLGDVAMDIVIDKDCKLWILEVQVNYTVESKANRGKNERRILPRILPTPLEYAKALTGFSSFNEDNLGKGSN